MERSYLVYKLQCPANGKIYIGVTCQRPEFRWCNGVKPRKCEFTFERIGEDG